MACHKMFWRLNSKNINFFPKKLELNQGITELHVAVLRYMQRLSTKAQQYVARQVSKFWKAVDVYDERILNEVFIDVVDLFIHRRLR